MLRFGKQIRLFERIAKIHMIPAMNVTRQYESIKEEIDTAVSRVLSSGQYILGKEVEDFEKSFAEYCGVKYAVGVGNGTDALIMALRACGVGNGDEVIVPAMSFVATSEAVVSCGAKPVFVDCESDTYTIDVTNIEKKITEHTKAIVPVHLYGQCADMDSINKIAKKHGLKVIEDAAQAVGSEYLGKKAGSMGDAGCFSFFPTKNLGCAGDGGIIVTDDESIYRQCRALRVHGSGLDGLYTYSCLNNEPFLEESVDFNGNLPKYYNYVNGYNSRLDAIQAALLSVKLKHLDDWNEKRRYIAKQYNDRIINKDIAKPHVKNGNIPIYYVYTISTEKRDDLRSFLKDNDIGSGVYFPVALPRQRVYDGFVPDKDDYPVADHIANHTLVLPMFPELTEEELNHVIDTVNSWKG